MTHPSMNTRHLNSQYYDVIETYTPLPLNSQVKFHTHDDYEIILFLEGDANIAIEDKSYSMSPCDMAIIRKHELHRLIYHAPVPYHRIVLRFAPAFFQENSCLAYEALFTKVPFGTGHKISAEAVRSSGLYDAILRYRNYSENYTLDPATPVLKAVLIEILYLMSKISGFADADLPASPISSVILYLNTHYTEDITLDMLQEKFFLSKYYLCRAFRKASGMTVHEYLCRKRLLKVQELKSEGISIGKAAVQAGFHDYSSFYRAYKKEYGTSPSQQGSQDIPLH